MPRRSNLYQQMIINRANADRNDKIMKQKKNQNETMKKNTELVRKFESVDLEIESGNFDNLDFWLDNIRNPDYYRLCQIAISYNKLNILEQFQNKISDIKSRTDLLITACHHNNIELMYYILDEWHGVRKLPISCLLIALDSNNIDMINWLLGDNKYSRLFVNISDENYIAVQSVIYNNNKELLDKFIKLDPQLLNNSLILYLLESQSGSETET